MEKGGLMLTKPILQIINVTKRIGSKVIIDQLNLEVPKGEIFGFLGPNGAGKTTTIRMMVGLMSITEGDILIDGESITRNFNKAIIKVGAIVENPEMYKYLSGYKNLIHFARMVPGVTEERIQEVIQLVGLENRIQDKVRTYSLGMRQRLGVAQALLHRPSLLILDEPTNGLDPAGIRELRDYLYTLTRKEGISVLVSSHLLSEMELMCDRVAIIQAGKVVEVQSIKDLMSEELQSSVRFEVDNLVDALRILSEHPTVQAKEAEGELDCWLEREQIAEVTEDLIKKGIKIYGIRKNAPTLEDKFLKITGGEKIG
ncbi:bacitracin ABC transporter ATP-binding protein [Paenibacillus pectinilyticus]|uniref:Bacitracin ABC transporter ATP-binding protein n=2 Tax=Paenibacillus pectinilyticus TaxID=512399 RepID=A0A1C0ZVZ1_9BACL|nr:ABC transporter ATP-binding protein [Paenibacillus pectinilyticus]OCT12273.1 bacitracin ABC transporter ATP-binding protein [Paenibacillus pectinilyticus]